MITKKSPEEISIMREGGKILAGILEELSREVRPGISTYDLEERTHGLVSQHKVKPTFLHYNGFPAMLCVSVNHEVVHGVPRRDKILNLGDIVSIDMGITYKGFNTDSAITVPVLNGLDYAGWAKESPKSAKSARLIETTKAALNAGIKQAKIGNCLGKISNTIQNIAEREGFGVIREMVGHGIGRQLHEEPQIPNYGHPDDGPVLEEGMVLAIEPMISAGDWHLVQDGLAYKTKDGSYAAHFEHTVAITKKGPEVLTQPNPVKLAPQSGDLAGLTK